jgi:hypothetical protein
VELSSGSSLNTQNLLTIRINHLAPEMKAEAIWSDLICYATAMLDNCGLYDDWQHLTLQIINEEHA